MAVWSQLRPEIAALNCSVVAHPWTDSCLLAAGYLWVDCFIGSSGFFGLLYLCQYVSTVLKNKKKAEVKDFLRKQIRSTLFGATLSASIFALHCLLRRLIGRYTYPTLVFVPALLGGFSIFLEHRKGRELYANAFANCCTELFLRLLEHLRIIKWNSNIQTVIFMGFSSLLSYLISWTKFDLNYFWFFLPPKVNETGKTGDCFHEGDCKTHIFQLFVKYSSTGLILQSLRLFLNNFKNLRVFLSSLMQPNTFKLAAFLGGYVVVYQAIRCFLYQKEGKYSLTHDGLAGFLAGLAFRFRPTIPIFNSAIITTVQILAEAGHRKKILPNIPYLELIFAISCGVLFHYRILSEFSPRLTIYFMSGVTHGFSDQLFHHFKDTLKRFNLKSFTY